MEHSKDTKVSKPRLNIRCEPEQMDIIRAAADLELRSVSSFVLVATLERARQKLASRTPTKSLVGEELLRQTA